MKKYHQKRVNNIIHRPRRLRSLDSIRDLVSDVSLSLNDIVCPIFICEDSQSAVEIKSMPGIKRYTPNQALSEIEYLVNAGLKGFNFFPYSSKKSNNLNECIHNASFFIQFLNDAKKHFPETVISVDIAFDPFTLHGHDGFVIDNRVDNDSTLFYLGELTKEYANAGIDFIAPSDMMDGRVGFLRDVLDQSRMTEVGIISYSTKFASSLYSPFREALNSAPSYFSKNSYQMDFRRKDECLIELELDILEGADIIMIKPGLLYLDIVYKIKERTHLPLAVYNVSGEYSLLKNAANEGYIDFERVLLELMYSFKRAGVNLIFTYFYRDLIKLIK